MAIDIGSLARNLLLLYDPSLDVSLGSRMDATVVTPLVQRLEPQLSQTSAASFLRSRLDEAYPELDGYGFEDTQFTPSQVLATSVQRELARLEVVLGSPRFELLTLEEARIRAAQMFVYGADGTRTQTTIRVFFATARDRPIPADAAFYGANNLRYYPVTPRTVLSEEQEQDSTTGEYYADILCFAENTGSRYNVQPNTIKIVLGVPGAVRCTNMARQTIDGVDADTQEVLYQKVLNTAERSLTKLGGITLYIEETFPTLFDRVRVVKSCDEEMVRDRLRIELEVIGQPIMYIGSEISELSGSGEALILEFAEPIFVNLQPDVTNLFLVTTAFGMRVGDILTIDNFDLPILAIDSGLLGDVITIDSVQMINYGNNLEVRPYLVFNGADLLRSDIIGLVSGAEPFGVELAGDTGDYIFAQTWPTVATGPSTYPLTLAGGEYRAGQTIDIYRTGLANPAFLVYAYDGSRWGLPIGTAEPQPGLADQLITIHSIGVGGLGPEASYEFEIDTVEQVGGGWVATVLMSTLGVPSLLNHQFDFTVHDDVGFVLDSNNRFPLPTIQNESLWMTYRLLHGALAPGNYDFQYRQSASVGDFQFRLNGQVYEDYLKIGGMTDVYLRDRESGEEAATLDPIPDNFPIFEGKCVLKKNVGSFSFIDLGFGVPVQRNDMIYLISGCELDDVGGHRVIEVYVDAGRTSIRVPILITSPVANMVCRISRDLYIDAFAPEHSHARGSDMITMLESSRARTEVSLANVVPGTDILRIHNGPDADEYIVQSVSAPYLEVDGVFNYYTENLTFEIFSPSGTIVKKPLIRVTDVTREETPIPYAYPSIAYLLRSVTSVTKVPNSLYAANDAIITHGSTIVEFEDMNPVEVGISIGDYLNLRGVWCRIEAVTSSSVTTNVAFSVPGVPGFEGELDYSIGSPSRGVLRLLFTEPTNTWLPADQAFYFGEAGAIRFQVPPTYEQAILTAAGEAVAGIFESVSTDLVDGGIEVGDFVYIKTRTILSESFADIEPVGPIEANLSGTTLGISVGGVAYAVFFTGAGAIPLTQISPPGVVEQIRAAIPGLDVFAYNNMLAIKSDQEVEILASSAASILNFSVSTNLLPDPEAYVVQSVFSEDDAGTLRHYVDTGDIGWNTGSDLVNATFVRKGNAFITASQRQDTLYQADINIESIGFGTSFNLAGGVVLTAEQPIEGFRFEDEDEGLSFSSRETGSLVIRAVVPVPGGYAIMDKMDVRFRYGPNIPVLQDHIDDDNVRHLGNNILIKVNHEAPVYRSLDASGVTSAEVIARGARNYIRNLGPREEIEVFDFHRSIADAGARNATEPTPLFLFYEDALRRRQGVVVVNNHTLPKSVMPVVGYIG